LSTIIIILTSIHEDLLLWPSEEGKEKGKAREVDMEGLAFMVLWIGGALIHTWFELMLKRSPQQVRR
jgi:hypothetical protein